VYAGSLSQECVPPTDVIDAAVGADAPVGATDGPTRTIDGGGSTDGGMSLADGPILTADGASPGLDGAPRADAPPRADAGPLACVPYVQVGDQTSCAIEQDGSLWCWGASYVGGPPSSFPIPIPGAPSFASLGMGHEHICGLTADGHVSCWGANYDYQTGYANSFVSPTTPTEITSLQGTTALATGGDTNCAVLGGDVYCWGANTYDMAGDFTGTASFWAPHKVAGTTGATLVAVGLEAACSYGAASGLVCWGRNDWGQLGVGDTAAHTTGVVTNLVTGAISDLAAGLDHFCALRSSDGSVWCWGSDFHAELGDNGNSYTGTPFKVSLPDPARHLGVGDNASCAITTTGALYCWGADGLGQLGDGRSTYDVTSPELVRSGVTSISIGGSITTTASHSCAINADATIRCAGDDRAGELGDGILLQSTSPLAVQGLSDATGLAGDAQNVCAIRGSSSTLSCWGEGDVGAIGDNAYTYESAPATYVVGMTSVVEASVGDLFGCALSGGGVYCWGVNYSGNLGNMTTQGTGQPTIVYMLSGVTQLATGYLYSCALKSDGTVWCWGANEHSQLGDNTTTEEHQPVKVLFPALPSTIAGIAAGDYHACAWLTNGDVWCWGDNSAGQMGSSSPATQPTPVQITTLANVRELVAGNGFTCARDATNAVGCLGGHVAGILGDGMNAGSTTPVAVTGLTNATQLSAGSTSVCALRSNQKISCWGLNTWGQLGDGTTMDRNAPVDVLGLTGTPTAVLQATRQSCALMSNGTAQCWGNNQEGQLGIGSKMQQPTPTSPLLVCVAGP
jgi:alpha-tubulin suppressor-like RCC1 family protein